MAAYTNHLKLGTHFKVIETLHLYLQFPPEIHGYFSPDSEKEAERKHIE